MVRCQDGHLAYEKPHSTQVQRFSSRIDGGGRPTGEPADPGGPGKTAIK